MITFCKRIIISVLAQLGYEFGRVKRRVTTHPTDKCIDVLPLLVRELAARKREISFVQIGANDGVRYDPLHPLVSASWRGLLVEPNPEVFKKLQETYRHFPLCQCAQVAVVSLEHPGKTVVLHTVDGIGDETGRGSLSKDAAAINLFVTGCRQKTVELPVPAVTLPELLRKHGFMGLDVLVVDAEGCDYEIMRSLVASADIRPSLIQFENSLMSPTRHDMICASLSSLGYAVLPVGYDTIAQRKEKA